MTLSADTDRMHPGDADAIVARLFFTPAGRRDPYPLYHQLRAASPVHRTPLGCWVLSRYDDCWAVMRDPRFAKDYPGQMAQRVGPEWRRHVSLSDAERSLINLSGPAHTRLRKRVAKAFTPRTIERLRPRIEAIVSALLEPVGAAGGGDLQAAIGFPLPVTVIGELLGVPEDDRPQLRGLVDDLVGALELQPSAGQLAAADAAQTVINDYFLGLLAAKRRHPGEDLLSALAGDDGEALADDDLVTLAGLLFEAGFETTTNLFGLGMLALLRHPDELARLREDPGLCANLPDELLRYDGSVQLVNRVTEATVDVGGVSLAAGEQVFALLGAGNRDPSRYPHPDRLDVTRTDIHPLTFGGGVHFCLGAALARAELEIVFRAFVQRFDRIELAGDLPVVADRLTFRGLPALHVFCGASAGVARAPGGVRAAATAAPVRPPGGARPDLRPGVGDTAGDLRWRATLRERIETTPARPDSVPIRGGAELAAMVALFTRNPLFARCTQAELEELAATTYPMTFEPGDLLCVEGTDSPEAYMIAEGRAAVTIGRKGVAVVEEDDVVGERGVLLDTVRAATVTAMEHMVTYALSRERLRAVLDRNPEARQWMLDEMRRRYPA